MKVDMSTLTQVTKDEEEIQMAPMIDIVFLLLIYFIMTTTLQRTEADLGIQLPGQVVQSRTIAMPDEQIIEVMADGQVVLNGRVFDSPASRVMPELTTTLVRFRQASATMQTPAMVTIQASGDAIHQRVIDVMNACAAAGITHVSFGME